MKIVYCTDSICYLGGIQKVTIAKANALSKVEGNDVYIIVTDNKLSPIAKVDPKVQVLDLNINYFENDWKGKFYVIKSILIKRSLHKKKLEYILNIIKPDIVISTGTSEKNFLPRLKIKSNPIFIREIHSIKNYRKLSASGIVDYIIAFWGDIIDYKYRISLYDRIVVLTNEDKNKNWKDNSKVIVIPNPLLLSKPVKSSLMKKCIITSGRLVPVKNFASLIRSFKNVVIRHPDWVLEIWGEGSERKRLEQLITEEKLIDSVFLKGYTNDIISKLMQASIFVCSSIFEGWSLAIIEAMSVGLPVVSYACPYGPKDIITNKLDGFLIPLNNESKLAEAICELIENEPLRLRMGCSAQLSSQNYSMSAIIGKWMNLFRELIISK